MENSQGSEPKRQPLKLEPWQTPTPFKAAQRLPPKKPSTTKPRKKVPGFIIIASIVGGIVLVSSLVSTASDPRKNPSETWSNGKATCERLIEGEEGQKPRSIRSDVFEPSVHTYKMSTWVQYAPVNRLYTCRLLWNGKSWNTDLFEYR
jgi:hypothetical protein